MRIVIIGGDQTGAHLAEKFCADEHDVVVIDSSSEALAELDAHLDLMTVHGNGADPAVLEEADVERADMVVAVTDRDDTNLLACIFARARGVGRTVARVSSSSYSTSRHIDFRSLGVDLLVNQYDEYARDLYNVLRLPGTIEVADLLDERVMVVGMSVHMDSPLLGNSLKNFSNREWLQKIRFTAVVRGDQIMTPHGDTTFLVGDEVYFAGETEAVADFMQWAWPEQKRFQRVVIAGGGELGLQLARMLEHTRMQIVLIEQDEERADFCSAQLNRTLVIKGDALDQETLAGIGEAEDMAYVAATGSDEHNIIGCLVAEKYGARFTAAQVGKREYIGIINQLRLLDRIVDPRLAMVNSILHFVRGKNVQAAAILARLPGELIELRLSAKHKWAGKAIKDLKIPDGVIIVTTLRKAQVQTPTGDLLLSAGDRVVVYCLPAAVPKMEPLFTA
ncbi:MAG: Trk system potassium transporter TrkA [Kiritimatiellae bacterium]|jgi:trk system potassium uptake protein TrkA|nr:Trk system potassium transporter TrkA [Kiritimatiellia bacterium]NLD89749.1 Trk system potassium transporter TrkA [Lentisphaerota bacterium]HPC19019.1 Trk system potassium transporter TrkA [Kiritimatiellia bacterium]HQN80213.1 Trk system potassium transporter TrkA [Kiritimatiellia bacterium]